MSAVFELLFICVTVIERCLSFFSSGITVDIHAILSKLGEGLMAREGRCNIINVNRDDVLDGGLRGFSRKTFNEKKPLIVKFSGEQGQL